MKGLALSPWYRTLTIATVRWKLYQTAGVIVSHARQVLLKLAVPIDKIALFHKFRRRCYEISCFT